MFNLLELSSTEISMIVLWAIITIFAIIIEFETINLVSIWFVAGGICGIVTAALHQPIWLQILLFVIVTAVFVALTRPFVKKMSDNQTIYTNADRLIGLTGVVTKEIKPGEKGEVKIEFQTWQAISKDNQTLNCDTQVIVLEIIGNKLLVQQIKEIDIN